MSLVLPLHRPAPVRGVLLSLSIATGLLASASSLAPTIARTAGALANRAVCHCPHCKGGAACCCLGKQACPVP